MKKNLLKVLYFILLLLIVTAIYYAWPRVPVMTGLAAKGMCSGVFVADRDPASVSSHDLEFFPISLVKTRVNYEEKSVTATLFGLAKRKAVYRNGLGSALLADFDEKVVRNQAMDFIPSLQFDPDTVDWPLGDRILNSHIEGVDYQKLEEILNWSVDHSETDSLKKTFGVAVVYKNRLVGEIYGDGFDHDSKLLGWSMSKSITNALIGILVKEGKLSVDQPAPIPEWADDERNQVTINHLMHMTSGQEWIEDYFNVSDVTKMLYMSGDMYSSAIVNSLASDPGTTWYYSSGTTNTLSGIIRNTIDNDSIYHLFPRQALFNRLGMGNTVMEADASGNFVGSSYAYATTRDWARFGLLYLNNGVFVGDTVLPRGWVDYTRQAVEASNNTYGAQFWLNQSKKLPDVPEDMFFADGFKGQRVFIIPSKDLVVVRLGYSHENFDFNEFLSKVISVFPED